MAGPESGKEVILCLACIHGGGAMEVIQDSAEDHFLTLLEKIKQNPGLWVGIHCAFSRQADHDALIADLPALPARLSRIAEGSQNTLTDLTQKARSFTESILYQFADKDILFLAKPSGTQEHDDFYALFKTLTATHKSGLIDFINFGREMMNAHKLADAKFLSRKKIEAYGVMCDANRIGSLPIRRRRRDHAVALAVEDDRFTATYTAGILNKVCDLVQSRTGEDAIIDYIEHAPDIVFLDIHLPGLSGLETLHAIRQADPEAHVIIVSVDTVKNNIAMATKRGASGFLKKPFSKERLLTLVEKSPFVKGGKIIKRS
jgi:CheY-like chemotaxis protein